jgi:RHS repeat-associated protein
MIEVASSSPTIRNSTIRKSGGYGIKVVKGGSPEITNNKFVENFRYAINYGAEAGNTGEINIHGNTIEKGGGGIWALVYSTSVYGKTLSSNTVTGTTAWPIYYSGPDIPGDITQNVVSGNTNNAIFAQGTVAHSSTWVSAGSTIIPELVTVAPGVSLTMSPGLVVLPGHILTVKGTLLAEGSAEKPVVFTNGSETTPGEWQIKFEPGSGASVLDHVEAKYGGGGGGGERGMIEVASSSPTIRNSTIRKSGGYGIKVTGSGSPTVRWNRFRSNFKGLSYGGPGVLPAPSNDWGCASGPKPAGCGDSVTSNVTWKPSVQLSELGGHCRGKESQCGRGADPVSLATGQLDYSHRDLLLTNKSTMPIEFLRSYSSGSNSDTGLGPGWSQTGLASATELESGEVLILRPDGRQDLFSKVGEGYAAPSGVTDTLAKVEGTFQLKTIANAVYRFDESGRIASIIDDHGLKTTYAYTGEGRLATITDPSAQTLTFSYNGSNHITLVKDSTGREVKFGYSAAGDLETVTDALGGVTKYGYDAQHRITSITDPRGNVILKNVYDGSGRIVEQRDGLEHLWKLEYVPGETVVTEPQGGKRKYGFDGQSRVVSETDQLGHTTTTSYDAAGNVDEVVQPGGAPWKFGHDAAGNLTSVVDPEGGERTYEYDGQNRLVGFTDARGSSWTYEWSKANDLIKVEDPEGGETALTYSEAGLPMARTDPDGHKTEFTYDSRGNQLSTTDPLGHKTSLEYNSRNYLTSRTAPSLKAEAFERDALGGLLARTTPEGSKTKYVYDGNGLLVQMTDPGGSAWKIERNPMERPTVYVDPLEQQTKITYDGNLNPISVTDRRGEETSYHYDLANQLTAVDRPEGGDWGLDYDARGNRVSVTDPRENETTYEYDLLNRMTGSSEPLGVDAEYGYDASGDLTSVVDPRGNSTAYVYDKLGRLTEVTQPLGRTTTYAYDGVGNRLSKTTAAGTLEYSYDVANRLKNISGGESTLRSFSYDAANRRIGAVGPQGDELKIGYDGDGRVTSINDGRGQSVIRSYDARGLVTKQSDLRGTLEYGYDKLGRMTSLADPQGKSTTFAHNPEGAVTEVIRPSGVTTTSVYDDAGRLTEASSVEAPSTDLESLEYSYDPAGNVRSRNDLRLGQETTYAYDALNRLTEFDPPGEGATAYEYDAAGNRTNAGSVSYTYDALNQLTSSSEGTTYGYDGDGRLTEEISGSEETTFLWDPFDHLAKVEAPAGNVTYSYDALGRLIERVGGVGTQAVHYGDLTDLPTYDVGGGGATSYVQGGSGLLEQRSGEVTQFPLADSHGDITAITGPGGGVESRQTYDPWGAHLSGPSLEMGYLGSQQRRTDPASGLIQMGERAYSPQLGGFLSEDPVFGHVGHGTSFDRHVYVWDNPLNRYDLEGRDVCVFSACAEDAVEGVAEVGGELREGWGIAEEGLSVVGSATDSAAEGVWGWTAPGRGFVSDRFNDFIKTANSVLGDKVESFLVGCATGGGTTFLVYNEVTGGTTWVVPVYGEISNGVAALGGCVLGGGGSVLLGFNPIRRN